MAYSMKRPDEFSKDLILFTVIKILSTTRDLRLKNVSQQYLKSIFLTLGVLATGHPVILAYSIKRSDNFSKNLIIRDFLSLRYWAQ